LTTRKIFYILIIVLLGFVIAVAAYDPLRIAVRDTMASVGGSTWTALENGWAGIAATPIYQSYHMFLWLAGGMVLMWAVMRAYHKNKIPLFKPKVAAAQPQMGAPSTVIITEQPTPTKAKTETPPPTDQQASGAS
jgi:hypothetical protein